MLQPHLDSSMTDCSSAGVSAVEMAQIEVQSLFPKFDKSAAMFVQSTPIGTKPYHFFAMSLSAVVYASETLLEM